MSNNNAVIITPSALSSRATIIRADVNRAKSYCLLNNKANMSSAIKELRDSVDEYEKELWASFNARNK